MSIKKVWDISSGEGFSDSNLFDDLSKNDYSENKENLALASDIYAIAKSTAKIEARKIIEAQVPKIVSEKTKSLLQEKDVKDEIKKEAKKTVKDVEDRLDRKIDDSRTKTIETLGIFVALFTFVSLQFQAFSMLNSFQAIGAVTLIILGALILFIIVLDLVVKAEKSVFTINKKIKTDDKERFGIRWLPIILFVVSIVFVLSGVCLLSTDNSSVIIEKEQQEINFNNFQTISEEVKAEVKENTIVNEEE